MSVSPNYEYQKTLLLLVERLLYREQFIPHKVILPLVEQRNLHSMQNLRDAFIYIE